MRKHEIRNAINDLHRNSLEATQTLITNTTSLIMLEKAQERGASVPKDIWVTYELSGKMRSGELVMPYTEEYSVPFHEGLRECIIQAHMANSGRYEGSEKSLRNRVIKTLREMPKKVNGAWRPEDYFVASMEIWPYDDRVIVFDSARLVNVFRVEPRVIPDVPED